MVGNLWAQRKRQGSQSAGMTFPAKGWFEEEPAECVLRDNTGDHGEHKQGV